MSVTLSLFHLEKIKLFKNLRREDLIKLVQLGKIIEQPKGTILIHQNSSDRNVYGILKGQVEILVTQKKITPHGDVLATLGVGDTVGELGLVTSSRRTATVRAASDVELVVWDPLVLHELFHQDNGLGFRIMSEIASTLAKRLSSTNQVVRDVVQSKKVS